MVPESTCPSSKVTVCGTSPELIQVIVVPTRTVSAAGRKLQPGGDCSLGSTMLTVIASGGAMTGVAAGGTVGVMICDLEPTVGVAGGGEVTAWDVGEESRGTEIGDWRDGAFARPVTVADGTWVAGAASIGKDPAIWSSMTAVAAGADSLSVWLETRETESVTSSGVGDEATPFSELAESETEVAIPSPVRAVGEVTARAPGLPVGPIAHATTRFNNINGTMTIGGNRRIRARVYSFIGPASLCLTLPTMIRRIHPTSTT
jgi:hypothetical protein